MTQNLLRISKLCKSYGGVHALRDVDLELAVGEVHAICGENGAGKSTLINILTGVTRPNRGEIQVAGRRLTGGVVAESEAAGIAVMHQEPTIFPDLNVIDNVFVGRERTYAKGWLLDYRTMRQETLRILERLGELLNLDLPVRELSVAQRQVVAMARALACNCKLLIMDEPTASLSARETANLLNIVRQLRSDGVSVLYVSHRLNEVFQVADRVTVLRDGARVLTSGIAEMSEERLIQAMVGRELDALFHRHERELPVGEVVLEVVGLTRSAVFQDISFTVRGGEIVGLAGLVGAGRSEIARAIFGCDSYDSGSIRIRGRTLVPRSVPAAKAAGLALVPEDRQHEGLVLPLSVGENLSLAMLSALSRMGLVRRRHERALIEQQMQSLAIRAAGPGIAAATLSGGNQQKLVLGKWLATEPQVLILDEPTRGVDVAAKAQVHALIRRQAAQGVALLVISSELPELLAISDRVLVVRQGQLVGELCGASATQEQVLALALGDPAEVPT